MTAALDLFYRPILADGEAWRIDCADATAWLRGIATASVDCVVTDPAYESLEEHRSTGTTTRLKVSDASSNEWFPIFRNERFPDFLAEVYRVLARDTHFYMYCDHKTMRVVVPMAEAVGFKFWKPIVWDKVRIGMGYHYRCRYEFVLFLEKGKRRLADLGIADIITSPRVTGYPTEKPVAVSEVLIGQSTERGQLVIDPFAGSASVGEAALKLGRRFAGCDVKESAVALGSKRLGELASGGVVT